MEKRWSLYILSFFIFGGIVSGVASADSDCSTARKRVEQSSATASAAVWANYRNNPGSLRFESERLLTEAITKLPSAAAPEALCGSDCGKPSAEIAFSSIPAKFLSSYSDKDKCERLEKETKSAPLKYSDRRFQSLKELNDWFSEFSQGKGKDGSDLYTKCDGDCSPQYTLSIEPKDGKFLVDASVLCGPARDKDNNEYKLQTAYSWKCS